LTDFWQNSVRFTYEAQGVISARLMLFAAGAPQAALEAERMVSEKLAAFSEAHDAAEQVLAEGLSIYAAAERAYAPLQRCVHDNNARLLSMLH
jgi:hypothetical protein